MAKNFNNDILFWVSLLSIIGSINPKLCKKEDRKKSLINHQTKQQTSIMKLKKNAHANKQKKPELHHVIISVSRWMIWVHGYSETDSLT